MSDLDSEFSTTSDSDPFQNTSKPTTKKLGARAFANMVYLNQQDVGGNLKPTPRPQRRTKEAGLGDIFVDEVGFFSCLQRPTTFAFLDSLITALVPIIRT